MAAAASTLSKEIDDITECSICTELYQNPKALPCLHTFCLRCLEGYGKDNCPLCRQEFTIPQGGLSKLPGNFFIEKLVEIRKFSDQHGMKRLMCDLCSEENEADPNKTATKHCVNCTQNLCIQCCRTHQRARSSQSHQIVELGDQHSEILLKARPNFCEQHSDKQLELWCKDCSKVLCMMCFAIGHTGHKTEDINAVAEQFRLKLEKDIERVKVQSLSCQNEAELCEQEKTKFIECIKEKEVEINARSEQILQLVVSDQNKLIQELQNLKEDVLKKKKVPTATLR